MQVQTRSQLVWKRPKSEGLSNISSREIQQSQEERGAIAILYSYDTMERTEGFRNTGHITGAIDTSLLRRTQMLQ